MVDEISKKTLKKYENEIKSEDRIKAITLDTGSKDENDKNKKGCCN